MSDGQQARRAAAFERSVGCFSLSVRGTVSASMISCMNGLRGDGIVSLNVLAQHGAGTCPPPDREGNQNAGRSASPGVALDEIREPGGDQRSGGNAVLVFQGPCVIGDTRRTGLSTADT